MQFVAIIGLDGKTATGIEVPADVLAALGPAKRPKVSVTINDYTYPSTIGSLGGRSLIPLSAEVRARAGVSAGDQVTVDVVADDQIRRAEVPADLAAALDRDPEARRAFEKLSYSHQRRHVLAIDQAKTLPTRERRVTAAVIQLAGPPAG